MYWRMSVNIPREESPEKHSMHRSQGRETDARLGPRIPRLHNVMPSKKPRSKSSNPQAARPRVPGTVFHEEGRASVLDMGSKAAREESPILDRHDAA